MTTRTWPWQCHVQDPTHKGMAHSGDPDHPPTDPRATCVSYINDWDLAHPDNPLTNPPRHGLWVYCVPQRSEGSPLTADEAASYDEMLADMGRRFGVGRYVDKTIGTTAKGRIIG